MQIGAPIGAIDRLYRWQGAVHEHAEWRPWRQTAPDRVDALLAARRERHPCERPARHAWPVPVADPDHADAVLASTRPD